MCWNRASLLLTNGFNQMHYYGVWCLLPVKRWLNHSIKQMKSSDNFTIQSKLAAITLIRCHFHCSDACCAWHSPLKMDIINVSFNPNNRSESWNYEEWKQTCSKKALEILIQIDETLSFFHTIKIEMRKVTRFGCCQF